jgi:DNA modification methylase
MTKLRTRRSQKKTGKDARFDVFHGDARALAAQLPAKSVNVTITSPPYFDVKDYGTSNQIGFGQDYDSYLDDLKTVFAHIHRATRSDGSLWIVIDTFRRHQEVLPLPFDLVSRLKSVGWVLRDVIIWKKERTVPWVHNGSTKRIFEYILVLAKSKKKFRYVIDKERSVTDLKHWWVRYPERYNPRGKSLEEIWSYDIPTQGSWGKHYVRHFCPLPSALIERIVGMTTRKNDVVLDPFSGSGAVLAAAHHLGRRYIGFELNKKYISMFKAFMQTQNASHRAATSTKPLPAIRQFAKLIKNLRILKFARLLYRSINKHFGDNTAIHVLCRQLAVAPAEAHKICSAEFVVVLRNANKRARVAKHLDEVTAIRPLSKFGVDAKIRVLGPTESIPTAYRRDKIYLYTATNSHRFAKSTSLNRALEDVHPVVSLIRADVDVPDE